MRRLFGFLLLGTLLLALIVAVAWFQVQSEERVARMTSEMLLTRSSAEDSAEVSVLATGRWKKLPDSEPLNLRLVIWNRGDEALEEVRASYPWR